MPGPSRKKRETPNLEEELYLLIAKFLSTGRCKRAAEVLRKEIEEHQLLPKRFDWQGGEHNRSFHELEHILTQVADDHLLKICTRIAPILDKEVPPTVPGLHSLLGVGRQSLLRTKEDLQKPKFRSGQILARKHGAPLYPSPAVQATYPPNITQILLARELSGPISSRHVFSSKMYARQQIYRRLLGHLSSVYCVLFDRTGRYIFTGADDLLVKIWSATDGRLLAALRGHSAEITDMAVNHSNTLLAAGSCDKTIRVWCLKTTAPVAVLNGHTGMVTSLQFCPYPKKSEQLLVSTGNDGCICFWGWSPRTNLFNPKPLKFTERNKAGAQMICSSFSPGGLFLATGSTDHNVRVYNIAGLNGPERILETDCHSDRVDSIQFSNSDCRFVSGSKDGTALIWKYERQNWNSTTLKMTTKLLGNQLDESEETKIKLRVTMVGWTLDDSMVITAASDYSIKVWDSCTGALCHVLKGHEDEVFVLEAHPTDPRVILSSGHDGRIMLWDLITGTVIKNHFNLIEGQGHGAVFDCKWAPDGHMFASTDSHGHLSIFGFGSNDRYKKVPEEQFFHTDYRPLIRDINHHVLDEQTQCAPHLLPPPFLVDIDGNPYPPNLQRLVPGRGHCNDSQLIPYVTVSAEGEAEILEPVRPPDGDRPTIDDMIERLQQEQNRNGSSPHEADENVNERNSTDSVFSPHSSHRGSVSNNDRVISDPFSPRSTRGQVGHSRVGMRRTGDIEGVRQSVGNWQSRGNQIEVPAWVKRVVVKPMKTSLANFYREQRLQLADSEVSFFNREKKRRQLPDPSEVSYSEQEVRNARRYERMKQRRFGLRARSTRETRNNVFGEDYENPEALNFSSSSDSDTEQKEMWDESSGEDSGSGEYSDWTADAGLTVDRAKLRGSSSSKPSTSGNCGSSSRPRRHVSSDDDASEEEHEKGAEEEESEAKKKKDSPPKTKRKITFKKLPERFRPPEWLTDVTPHKAPYMPQIGDEIVYFRHGHELYVQAVKRARIYEIYMRSQPWRKMNIRDQEVAKIIDMSFENHPPRLCCLKLALLNPAGKQYDSFTVKYHDMADVIDFIVLKQNYDQAMHYDWKPGDRFRSAIDKAWWLGTIKTQKPLNEHFPDSMFQCFIVKWDNGEKEHMSPWDFEPIDAERMPEDEGGSIDIMQEERLAMMYVPAKNEWSTFGQDHDIDRISRGFTRIMELSIAEPFTAPVDLNRYPSYAIVVEYPMDLATIKSRVENKFYRRLEAVKFDVKYIGINASKFNELTSRIVKQAKCVVDLCVKFIDLPNCQDPMVLYHEMMEAKQSRSQDSQSELDVLCSESDSDVEYSTSMRLKRKKQRESIMPQTNKRLKLESLKYTSKSWKQQCIALMDQIYQWDDSTPFRQPVSLHEYPDYRNIIDCPMDLSTVKEKLGSNHYSNPIYFCKDMRLIFQNSRNYNTNKKSRIYSMTIRLSAMFEEHIRSIVSDWRSAVKYEEKLNNNQYVSNRRLPLPATEPDIITRKASDRSINAGASTSRAGSSHTSTFHRKEHLSRPGSSRTSHIVHSESSKSSYTAAYEETNGTGHKRKLKKPKDEEAQSSKAYASLAKKRHLKIKLGNSVANGMIKKSSLKKAKIKSEARSKSNVKRKASIAPNVRTRKKEKVENSSGSEPDGDDQNSDSDHTSNSNEDYDDKSRRRKKRRHRMLRESDDHEVQKRLRPRLHHIQSSHHQTRLASRRLKQASNFNSRLHSQSSSAVRSRSSTPPSPSHRRAASMYGRPTIHTISPLLTRSMKLLKSTTALRVPSLRKHRVSVTQNTKSCSDTSESDNSPSHNSKSESASNNSSSCSSSVSTSRNNIGVNDHSYSKDHSSTDSESHTSQQEQSDDNDYQSRRSTRATTRDSTKATRSALLDTKPERRGKKLQRIQTRNRGQRTVRYGEDSDDEYSYQNSDNENTEKVSISSRGRLRKLTSHGKALFSD